MVKSIYKYALNPYNHNVSIPSDKILSVIAQGNDIVVYALVAPENSMSEYDFRVFGTGFEVDIDTDSYIFLGTVQMISGLVFHIFYRKVS